MNWKTLTAVLSALAVILAGSWLVMRPHAVTAATGSIPTFSTAEIGREGHFFVGGHYVGEPGNETMNGAMYEETWVPNKIRHPYPIVIIGFSVGQNEYEFMQTPDGRPGWAYDFVNQGYTVYMMDFPGSGRAGYIPGVDGEATPQRSTNLIEEIWTGGRSPATEWSKEQHVREHRVQEFAEWPQWKKESQWPGESGKGKKGEPAFDYYSKMEVNGVSKFDLEGKDTKDDLIQLLDMIGQPFYPAAALGFGRGLVGGGRAAETGQGYRRGRTELASDRERREGRDGAGKCVGRDPHVHSLRSADHGR